MNKIKLLTIVALAGFAAVAASAANPTGVDIVTVQGTILVQTNNTDSSSTTKYNVKKIKVTTKDVLDLISNEFTTVSGITAPGTKLAVDYFYDGDFKVLDKNNNVLVADASENVDADDDYELYLDGYEGYEVKTGSYANNETKYSYDYTDVSEFYYENAGDTSYFTLNGLASVKESYNEHNSQPFSESFKFSGSGGGYFNGTEAVITASVSGHGKDVDDF